MLAGFLAVGGEGLGERGRGRGGVHLGCVVDFWDVLELGIFFGDGSGSVRVVVVGGLTLGDGATAHELNHGRVLEEDSSCAHFGCVVL